MFVFLSYSVVAIAILPLIALMQPACSNTCSALVTFLSFTSERDNFVNDCLLSIGNGSHHGENAEHRKSSTDETTTTIHMKHGDDANHEGGNIDKMANTLHTEQDDVDVASTEGTENNDLAFHSGS